MPASAGEALAVVLGVSREYLGHSADPDRLAEVRLGSAVAAEVKVALIAGAPRVTRKVDSRNVSVASPAGASRSRLAEIVVGCPGEVSDDIRKVKHLVPGVVEVYGVSLRAPDDTLGELLVVLLVAGVEVVVASEVERSVVALGVVSPDVIGGHLPGRRGHKTRRVELSYFVRETL